MPLIPASALPIKQIHYQTRASGGIPESRWHEQEIPLISTRIWKVFSYCTEFLCNVETAHHNPDWAPSNQFKPTLK